MKPISSFFTTLSAFAILTAGCNNGGNNGGSSTSDLGRDSMGTQENTTSTPNPDNINSGDSLTSDAGGLTTPMDTMMKKITATKWTGNFDIDYAIMMISHAQGMVGMSGYIINNGNDEKIKAIARTIMTAENGRVTKLKQFLKDYTLTKNKQGEGELGKAASELSTKMTTIRSSGNTDRDFAAMMIDHEQFRIDMGDRLQANGSDDQLKKLVASYKDEQTKNVRDLRAWMSTNK